LCDAGRVWLWKLNSISSACTLHMISIFYGNRYQGLELVTVKLILCSSQPPLWCVRETTAQHHYLIDNNYVKPREHSTNSALEDEGLFACVNETYAFSFGVC